MPIQNGINISFSASHFVICFVTYLLNRNFCMYDMHYFNIQNILSMKCKNFVCFLKTARNKEKGTERGKYKTNTTTTTIATAKKKQAIR